LGGYSPFGRLDWRFDNTLEDDPAYQPREDAKPRTRCRNSSLRSWVKLAMACKSAEALGESISDYARKGRRREPSADEQAKIDRMLGSAFGD